MAQRSIPSPYTSHLRQRALVGVPLAQLATYYPFGAKRNNEIPSNGFNEKRQYIGQYYDDATALSYLNARYYNGQHGKFLSQDPIARDIGMMQRMPAYILILNQGGGMIDQNSVLANPQLLNSYSYSANSPVTMSDPSGQFATLPLAAVGAGVGAIGGFAGQYLANVNADLAAGMGWRSLYGEFTPEKTERYGSSIATGFIAGAAIGACAGACTGAVAAAVSAGGAFSASMAKDGIDYGFDKYAFGKSDASFDLKQSVTTGATNAVISVVTAGLVKTVPQVRGVDISTFSKAALTGAHTQAKLATEGIVQSLTSIVASLKSIVAQMQAAKPAR